MGNGASASPRGGSQDHLPRAILACKTDSYDELSSLFGGDQCGQLGTEDWGRLLNAAAAHGSLLCLELLVQRLKEGADTKVKALKEGADTKVKALKEGADTKVKALGGIAARAAAGGAQPDALEIVLAAFGPSVLRSKYAAERRSGRLPIHCAAAAPGRNIDSGASSSGYRRAASANLEERAVVTVSLLAAMAPETLAVAAGGDGTGDTPLHAAGRS